METAFMGKVYLFVPIVLLSCYSSNGQNPVPKITKTYFRSDPFRKEFSSFASHLLNDPTLTNKTLEKKTDSTLFYFQGTYTRHNPFFFKPKRVEVALNELVLNVDSLAADTIYVYQLIAYNNDTREGTAELKKEFEKIYRHYKSAFSRDQYTENPAGDKLNGATYNFFDQLHAVAPFAISWYGPDENKEMCLILTIRMDTYLNKAILPVPFYTPQ